MSGYAATSGPHAVLWIARDAGLFEKNGLRTEVAYIRSGSTMAQTLVSGEIQMSQMGGPAMLAAGVAGMDVTFVAVALNTTPIVIMGTVSKHGRSQRQSDRRDALRFQHGYLGALRDSQGRTCSRRKTSRSMQLEDYAGIMGGIASGRIAAGALADPFTDAAKKVGLQRNRRPCGDGTGISLRRDRRQEIVYQGQHGHACSVSCALTRKPSRFTRTTAIWR